MTQLDARSRISAQPLVLRLHESDSVAVALAPLEPGQQVTAGDATLVLRDAIPRGHKFALAPLEQGDVVRKFGWAIGRMRAPAEPGDHVHTHNLETLLEGVEG